MPVAGLWGSDIPAQSGLKTVRDPYTGREVYVVPALRPDWAVLHVHEADAQGNARVFGSPFWDRSMSRAARQVIVTAERIVDTAVFQRQPELTLVPHFMVAAVVHTPRGAWPAACFPDYEVDHTAVRAYLAASRDPAGLRAHLAAADGASVVAR